MAKKHLPLNDAIQRALETCGKSRYVVSQDTGITQSALSRFVNGKGLNRHNQDVLAAYLGIVVSFSKGR